MGFKVDREECISCKECITVCPRNCICEDKNHKMFIDPNLCISCGACEAICPINCIHHIEKFTVDNI